MKKIILKKEFFSIYSDTKVIDGIQKQYDVINFGPRVGIILKHEDKILLVSQYRYLIDDFSLEIPGGSVSYDETSLSAANRELYEETGYKVDKLNHLLDYFPGLDNVDNRTSIFYSEIKKQKLDLGPLNTKEIKSVSWYSIKECIDMIKKGVILDVMTIVALLKIGNKIV